MNETRREIALAATIVGGLVIGTVAAGQAAGGPAPITFLTDHQGSLSYAGLADGEVAAPGLAWVALPACVNDEPGHSVEIRDVRLVNAQGVQVESVFVDATLREDDDAAGRLGSGAGAGWPAPDAEYSSWASGVTASCAEYRGGSLDRANRVHVVLSTTDLGASRIPAFDGVEVDWSAGRQEGTSRLSAALVFCPTQEQEAACQESLDAGEARREALHEAWATGKPAEPTDHLQWDGEPVDVRNLPDVRQVAEGH